MTIRKLALAVGAALLLPATLMSVSAQPYDPYPVPPPAYGYAPPPPPPAPSYYGNSAREYVPPAPSYYAAPRDYAPAPNYYARPYVPPVRTYAAPRPTYYSSYDRYRSWHYPNRVRRFVDSPAYRDSSYFSSREYKREERYRRGQIDRPRS
jgi:hypothetical protein